MKCPKCGYTSFPYLESCRKCGHGFAEAREVLGVYALLPNPPDLTLAYEVSQADAAGTTVADTTPDVDVGPLQEIEFDLADATDAAPSPVREPTPADPSRDIVTTFDLDAEPISPLSSPAPVVEQASAQEPIMLDLSDLEGLTIELREVADEEDTTASDVTSTPSPRATKEPIFDLDEDEESLACAAAESAGSDVDDRDSPPEYILEIDEELEFEMDELELEDADDEDDDDPDR
jgi:hypothetical protein